MSGTASTHLLLELAHTYEHGTLGPSDPVPECCCPTCETLAVGGSWSDARHAEEIVQHLSLTAPRLRLQIMRHADRERRELGMPMRLPAPSVLAALADRVPGSLRSRHRRRAQNEPLPVEAVRAIPLLEIASRLGLGEPTCQWGEPRVLCPFHDDHRPSLRLNPDKNCWCCDPCALGGDGIRLWMLVRRAPFADAVREMASPV